MDMPAHEQDSARGSVIKIIFICMFVMMGSLLYGVDSGQISGFMEITSFLKDFGYYDNATQSYNIHTPVQLAINLLMLTGSVLASFMAGFIGSRYGRRLGLLCCGAMGLVGPILQCSSSHIETLYIGRIFSGMGIGFASNFVPVYQAEVAPTHLRGMMIGLYQAGINVGQFVGACVMEGTYRIHTNWAWRSPLISQMVFPTLILAFVFFLPESPRWLLCMGRAEKAARAVRRLRGVNYPESQIHREINEISAHVAIEMELERSATYRDAFRGTDLRRTHIACGIVFFQAWTGISFITTYGTYFYASSGITDSFLATVITQFCQLAGILCMFPSVYHLGRRTILLWGGAAQTIFIFLVAIVGTILPNSVAAGKCIVAFCCLYGFFFSWSWGPVAWVVTSEISSNALRSRTQSMATTVSWINTLIIQIIVPYLINTSAADLGAKVGFIFGPTCLLGFVWAYIMVPETKGRSLEDLDELFANRVSVSEFPSYVCGMDGRYGTAKTEIQHVEDTKCN